MQSVKTSKKKKKAKGLYNSLGRIESKCLDFSVNRVISIVLI